MRIIVTKIHDVTIKVTLTLLFIDSCLRCIQSYAKAKSAVIYYVWDYDGRKQIIVKRY